MVKSNPNDTRVYGKKIPRNVPQVPSKISPKQ